MAQQLEFPGMPKSRRQSDPGMAQHNPRPDTPGQAVFNRNLSGYQFNFHPSPGKDLSTGTRLPHTITAIGPDKQMHGGLEWHPSHGEIGMIISKKSEEGKGIATAMWHRAHAVSQATRGAPPMQGQQKLFDAGKANRIIPPRHSAMRTEKGNRWAHKVGGYLPPWQKVSMYGGAED